MNSKLFSEQFPIGSHLCREPMPPMSEMKRDMEILKQNGFNLVKLQENWAIDEAVEGKCDFSKYKELIKHAAQLDMGVYLGLTCEQAPAWLYKKYPDCRMVGRDGTPILYEAVTTLPCDGKPGPCYDHSGAMNEQIRFIGELVKELGHFENIVVWNTWQEIEYWGKGITGQDICFCENTMSHFHEWLQKQYGDIDNLNHSWNTRHALWEDISPTRASGNAAKGPYSVDINWQYFMDNIQVSNILRRRAEAIKAADPLKRPVFAHKGGPIIGSGRDWIYADSQDFLGSSAYPAWSSLTHRDDGCPVPGHPFDRHAALLAETWSTLALRFDYIRSANKPDSPLWAAEFQGGPISTGFHKGRVPSPEDIRRWMLSAMASGVSAISFWVARAEITAYEQNGYSLLDSEGDSSPRFDEAGRIGQALSKHPELFGKATRPQADVAILINEWNYQLCMSLQQGGDQLPFSISGWHRILWDDGIPVDFLNVDDLESDLASGYKALILPFPLSLSENIAKKLLQYVRQGGNLISEAAPGRINEHGFCNRGEMSPTLRQLFGVKQDSFTMVREPDNGMRWSPPDRTWGEYLDATMLEGVGALDGHSLRPNGYIQTFSCDGSEALLKYGKSVSGVTRKEGKGSAWLLGTYVGHNGTAYRDPETRAAIRSMLNTCGISKTHDGELILSKRVIPGMEAWIFTNPTEETVSETVDASAWTSVENLIGEEFKHDGDNVELTVKSLDVQVIIVKNKISVEI